MPFIEERVETLEAVLAQTLRTVTSIEKRFIKKEYKERSQQEIQFLREEMRQFEIRAAAEWKKMRRQWGELSRTLGRMANDDGSTGMLYLVSSDISLSYEPITTLYKKRR